MLFGKKISEHVDKNFDTRCDICGEFFIFYGDANGDGRVDLKDAILLRQYLANYDYSVCSSTVVLGPGK